MRELKFHEFVGDQPGREHISRNDSIYRRLRRNYHYLSHYEQELVSNGYRVLQGEALKEFKSALGKEIDFPTKTTVLGVFDFRSFLNLGMLLTTSEKAKEVRSHILNIVISILNEKSGGSTKFINRRDQNYMASALSEENYYEKLTDAIKDYVDKNNKFKYSQIMDTIYKVVFCEKASEYKKLLEKRPNNFLCISAKQEFTNCGFGVRM